MIARFWLKHPVMTRASCICISIFLFRPNSGLISIDCYHYWDYQGLSQAILGARCSLNTDLGRPELKREKSVWTVNADWELEAEHTSLSIQIKVLIFAPRREAWTVCTDWISDWMSGFAPCLSPSSLTSTKVKVTPTSWFIEIIWEWPYKIEIER